MQSPGPSFLRRPTWIGAVLVVALFCVPLFFHLGRSDLEGDEPIYAFAVDLILQTGDWLTPRSIPEEETPFFEKPPLKFWIVAAGIRSGLLPHNEFGQRFWDALFGSIAFLYVFAIGRRLAGSFCGIVAVFFLFAHQPLVVALRTHHMEAALVLSYCGAIYHSLAWASATGTRARWLHPFAVAAFFVLGFMTKFVAAIFLPAILVVMPVVFPQWRARLRSDWRTWAAATVFVIAVTAPWFIYQGVQHGARFWDIILGEHVYKRMTAFLDPAHVHPWHFYFSSIYTEFELNKTLLPAACGLIALIITTVRYRWDTGVLMLLWFTLPLVAISFGNSKLYHYALPFLPPLALAAGYLPAVILRRDSPVYRAVERWGTMLSERFVRKQPRAVSVAAATVAVLALLIAAVTVLYGRFGLRVGGVTIFRNASVARPLLIGTLFLILSRHGRLLGGLVLPLLVLLTLPLDAYRSSLDHLDDRGALVKTVAACLAERAPAGEEPGMYVQAEDVGGWKYVYYFRKLGWERPSDRPASAVLRKLFVPEEERPVLLSDQDYRDLKTVLATPGALDDDPAMQGKTLLGISSVQLGEGLLLLLPGRYATCALAERNR